ncbi:hypothetical protein GC169_07480 [bacterium]|nr:hypothetical protein [bacterium]
MFGFPRHGDGLCLSRISAFMDEVRIDREWLSSRSLVIVGSNGKGSTARMSAAALTACGLRTGCFTSPHMFDVTERMTIGEERIPIASLETRLEHVRNMCLTRPELGQIGGFEALFLAALTWFRDEAVDAIVWEAGMGGRYDPVRLVRSNVVAFTALELEHTEILGPTEELIACDKIDALRPGGTLIVSSAIDPRWRRLISDWCALTERRPRFVGDEFSIISAQNSPSGLDVTVKEVGPRDGAEHRIQLSLLGRHQAHNALTAIMACEHFLFSLGRGPQPEFLLNAVSNARWPGRLERVATDPDLWIDVGHTPRAVDLSSEALLEIFPADRILLVFGGSAVKDIAGMAAIAGSRFPNAILTRPIHGGASPETFASHFSSGRVEIAPDTRAAALRARERATEEKRIVAAFGGLFLAAEVQAAWRGDDPATLEFF